MSKLKKLSSDDLDNISEKHTFNIKGLYSCYYVNDNYLYVAGYGSSQIAEILTREELPTPIMYKYSGAKLNNFDHPEI